MHPETEKMSKMKIIKIKEDKPELQPHEIPEVKKKPKLVPDCRVSAHTSITPDQEPRYSTN